jgi:hypothetical protein
MVDSRRAARLWTREHGEDHPDVVGWTWEPSADVDVIDSSVATQADRAALDTSADQ